MFGRTRVERHAEPVRGRRRVGIRAQCAAIPRRVNPIVLRLLAVFGLLAFTVLGPADPARTPTPVAYASGGDLLWTVTLPSGAQCGQGSALALVPGRRVGLIQYPVLLVTACNGTGTGTLNFLDPGPVTSTTTFPKTSTATLVKSITSTAPPSGWRSLAGRSDQADLIGCGNTASGNTVFSITFDSSGTATTSNQVFVADAGTASCDGLSWDQSDKTFYESASGSATINHFNSNGTPAGSFAQPVGCVTTGLAVAGASIFVACNNGSSADVKSLYQLTKSGLSVAGSLPTTVTRDLADIECDPVSLAPVGKDVLWGRAGNDPNTLYAFEIPTGSCTVQSTVQSGGTVVPAPAQCPSWWTSAKDLDTDGDGLLDCWEDPNVWVGHLAPLQAAGAGVDWDGDGTRDFVLKGADPRHKDLYVEIDYMTGQRPLKDPTTGAETVVNAVTAAFDGTGNGSTASTVTNPDGTTGIHLHLEVDDSDLIPSTAPSFYMAFQPCTDPAGTGDVDFDVLKNSHFGTVDERADANSVNLLNAKRFTYRYAIFGNRLKSPQVNSSGCAELPGNDLAVMMGAFTGGVGTADEQEGTLMHELGHTLNRDHGGDDSDNCKPNYISVMNYAYQFAGKPTLNRKLDYSSQVLPSWLSPAVLDENQENEPKGMGGPSDRKVTVGPPPLLSWYANSAINFNRDGDARDNPARDSTNHGLDVNNFGAGTGCETVGLTQLKGANDWAKLQYNMRASLNAADGASQRTSAPPEITSDNVVAIQNAMRPTLDIKTTASPGPVTVGSNLTYTITVENLGPGTASGVKVRDELRNPDPDAVAPQSNVTFVPTSSSGSCTQDAQNPGIVTCDLGALQESTTALPKITTITIVVQPTTAGTLTNTAAVTSDPQADKFGATSTVDTVVSGSGTTPTSTPGPTPTITPTPTNAPTGQASIDIMGLNFSEDHGNLSGGFTISNTSSNTAQITSSTITIDKATGSGTFEPISAACTITPTPTSVDPKKKVSYTFTCDTSPDITKGATYRVTVAIQLAPPSSKDVYSLTVSKKV